MRVQGQIGRAGLEDAEHGHDHLGRSAHTDPHHLLRPDAPFDERAGELIGAGIQFGVGEDAFRAID